jgi:hypothetical protein
MSPTLQRAIDELKHLTPQEQWELLGYLSKQLQGTVNSEKNPQLAPEPSTNTHNTATLLEETQGMWGHKSIEEIDDELNKQRQSDW